jgi:hypothetical protein
MNDRFKNAPITNIKDFSFVGEDSDKMSLKKTNTVEDVYILFYFTGKSMDWKNRKETYKYIHINSLIKLREGIMVTIDDYQL